MNWYTFVLGDFLEHLISCHCKLPGLVFQGSGRLLVDCIVICAVCEDRVRPLAIDNEVSDLIKHLTIWFEHVRLNEEVLFLLVLLLILSKWCDVFFQICRVAME